MWILPLYDRIIIDGEYSRKCDKITYSSMNFTNVDS